MVMVVVVPVAGDAEGVQNHPEPSNPRQRDKTI